MKKKKQSKNRQKKHEKRKKSSAIKKKKAIQQKQNRARKNASISPDHNQEMIDFPNASFSGESIDDSLKEPNIELKKLFSKYNATDIWLSLGVSELWLPNIGSPVKHWFALTTFASMGSDQFNPKVKIDSYANFKEFIEKVYEVLPSFIMLEDYLPEPDWGDIKTLIQGTPSNIFYGGPVERIVDFVEAFKICSSSYENAIADLVIAQKIQDYVISNINRKDIGNIAGISPGDISTPSESFWQQCYTSLATTKDNFCDNWKLTPDLIIKQGAVNSVKNMTEFSDLVMTGGVLPAIFIDIAGELYPVSLRSALSVVVQFWSDRIDPKNSNIDITVIRNIAQYLKQRMDKRKIFTDPFKLLSKNSQLPYTFASVIFFESWIEFVVVIHEKQLTSLVQIERDVKKLILGGGEWGVLVKESNQALKLCTSGAVKDVRILAVAVSTSLDTRFHEPPKLELSKIVFLNDFVTLFDSIKDFSELSRFWDYVDESKNLMLPMSGLSDKLGSFRNTNEILIDGAINPDMLFLDPHTGSNWRYEELSEFWKKAPVSLPYGEKYNWTIIDSENHRLKCLTTKCGYWYSWYTSIGQCGIHFLFRIEVDLYDETNNRTLGLFAHCLADSISERADLINEVPIFKNKSIVTKCFPNKDALISEEGENGTGDYRKELFSNWRVIDKKDMVEVSVDVNLSMVFSKLKKPLDASFESYSLIQWLSNVSKRIDQTIDDQVTLSLEKTKNRQHRFSLTTVQREVDAPDHANPIIPEDRHYKGARKDLAIVLKEQGLKPGRFELKEAKKMIDSSRDSYRKFIHRKIDRFERDSIIQISIELIDSHTAKYHEKINRLRHSLEHEVDYDRRQELWETKDNYIKDTRNLRYLLECSASLQTSGAINPTPDDVVKLMANIDWLFVLYLASDILHNDLEVAGLDINDFYIPEVFYSENREEKERAFALEMSEAELGLGLNEKDEANFIRSVKEVQSTLDDAYIKDTGFTFTHFFEAHYVLSHWQTTRGKSDLAFRYTAKPNDIINELVRAIDNLDKKNAEKLVSFMTLDPQKIRRLINKDTVESDVPVWEHRKRGHRYAIRPLVPTQDGMNLSWGPTFVNKSLSIWKGQIVNGYLPADFQWENIKIAIRNIKKEIESSLETKTYEVCSRFATYIESGIDFKRRFPKERFEDVGDYDVLAYYPDKNKWLLIECKYNQPPFCIKDARRLRERIFGRGFKRGQFAKIERRRKFVEENFDRVRTLLKWPKADSDSSLSIVEIYVSRDIYWWMRYPPYEVLSHFVRIDALEHWLEKNIKLS
ncbi:MAG: hypothetical protein HUN04_22395 [Desulfobacter sp.]|nr:MAG: hypothetical protein HUN04_22395 [Desulfobacter sp.]